MLLQNARILVIDDKPDEVENLLRMLNKNGLAYNYYKGDDLTQLPDKPLKGIRLLFLDFVLGTDGQSDNTKISTLLNVLKKTVSIDNGPYIILAWTGHAELLDLFKDKMVKSEDLAKPMGIIDMEKRECMNDLQGIERNIRQKISDKQILEILLEWEAHAKSAAYEVIKALSDISRPDITTGQSYDELSSQWNTGLERHIYRIAESSLGQNVKPDKNLLTSAQFSFTELFRDQVETVIRKETKPFDQLVQKIYAHKNNGYNAREKAYMTTAFLLIRGKPDGGIQPGNIYRFGRVFDKVKCENNNCYFNKTKLTKKEIVMEFFNGELGSYGKRQTLIKSVIPVLVEITPECDYAQGKWRSAKMVLGVLWPEKLDDGSVVSNTIKIKAEFIYKPVPIEYNQKIYYMTFNAQHLFNVSFEIFDSVRPILKARKELLVDIQHWFSRHMSRPGKTEF